MAGTSPAMTNESFLSRLLVLLVHSLSAVMPGHSRPKGRRALHAYVPGVHVLRPCNSKDVDGRDEPGHDK